MIAFTTRQLYDLVWSHPIKTIAAEFGVEAIHLARMCDEYDIPRPAPGYWQKLEFGKPIERPELGIRIAESAEPVCVRKTKQSRQSA